MDAIEANCDFPLCNAKLSISFYSCYRTFFSYKKIFFHGHNNLKKISSNLTKYGKKMQYFKIASEMQKMTDSFFL